MRFAAIVDVAVFIWDEQQFNDDPSQFYNIMEMFPKLLNLLIKEQIPVILRSELVEEVQASFPYKLIPNQYKDFKTITTRQLSKLNLVDYPDPTNSGISSKPPLARGHFSAPVKLEINHLINFMYADNDTRQRLLTFDALWDGKKNLTLTNGKSKTVQTTLCDDPASHVSIANGLKKIFEHNPKHRRVARYFKGKVIYRLRCYDARRKDNTVAQKILDGAVLVKGFYYGYDNDNFVYVKFLRTEKNLFHGFEVAPPAVLKEEIDNARNNA